MTSELSAAPAALDGDVEALHQDGITARTQAFEPDWVERMREDMMTAFWVASVPGGLG